MQKLLRQPHQVRFSVVDNWPWCPDCVPQSKLIYALVESIVSSLPQLVAPVEYESMLPLTQMIAEGSDGPVFKENDYVDLLVTSMKLVVTSGHIKQRLRQPMLQPENVSILHLDVRDKQFSFLLPART